MNKNELLIAELDMDAFLFYRTWDAYALLYEPVRYGDPLTVGDRVPLACMFDANWLMRGDIRIGVVFMSQFHVKNGGGYILAYLQQGIGRAVTVEVLLKTENLVIYHYPNRGTLVICPHVGDEVLNIMLEQ